jgi:hypothetical protein
MRSRRRDAEVAVVLRLIHLALVQIRASAYLGDADTARRLADVFHNVPTQLIKGPPKAVLADLRQRCDESGDSELFMQLLAMAHQR